MILSDLFESVTFGIEFPRDSNKQRYKKIETDCTICGGTGKENYGGTIGTCEYCHGTGKYKTEESLYPELNVSNSNARIILDMLGIPDNGNGLVGDIPNSQLPEFKRKLIKLKNSNINSYTRNPETYGGKTFVDRSGEVPRIKKTATIHDFGTSTSQITRYIDELLRVIDVAQKENGDLFWA